MQPLDAPNLVPTKWTVVTGDRPGEAHLAEEPDYKETEKHPLLIWTNLSPGDVVTLRGHNAQDYVGTVESKTKDGLIIWIRDNLNEGRLFHYRDVETIPEVWSKP